MTDTLLVCAICWIKVDGSKAKLAHAAGALPFAHPGRGPFFSLWHVGCRKDQTVELGISLSYYGKACSKQRRHWRGISRDCRATAHLPSMMPAAFRPRTMSNHL